MKKKNITKAQVYLLALLFVIALIYAYIHFIYDPAQRNLDQLNVQINLIQSEITRLGDPPDAAEARSKAEAAAERLNNMQRELDHIEETRKATMQPTVTKAMALINQLAVQNQLDVKHLLFMERVMEEGAQADAAAAERQRRERRRIRQVEPEEQIVTAADHFQWDRYSLVLTGSHSGMVSFMGDLSEAFWVVLINELEISLGEGDEDEQDYGEPGEQEYQLSLEIML